MRASAMLILLLICSSVTPADEPQTADIRKVPLFQAIDEELVEVEVIPRDYWRLTFKLVNRSDEPLQIELPPVFSALPEIKVRRQGGGSLSGETETGEENYSQGLGATFVRAGSRRGRRNEPPPALTTLEIKAGATFREQFDCFCLEFGKPDPNPRIPYRISPFDELSRKPPVRALLERYVTETLEQRPTQLAAWHLENGVPWEYLARMQIGQTTRRTPEFLPREIDAARKLVEETSR